jgi:hypothetical protein
LEEFRLPVLERGGQELGPEVGPGEALAVLLCVVTLGDHLGHELAGPGQKEQGRRHDAESVCLGEARLSEVVVVQGTAVRPR